MRQMGVATRDELDGLRKRVRDLERAAGMTASGRRRASAKKTTAKRRSAAKRPSASSGSSGTS
jgi:hypothetical protein